MIGACYRLQRRRYDKRKNNVAKAPLTAVVARSPENRRLAELRSREEMEEEEEEEARLKRYE